MRNSCGGISRSAFTLIELLVVIAIIAILAVVVVVTLNPAELLRQSRDSNRLSDLATINAAVNLYTTDQTGNSSFSLGNASSVYLSLPDTSPACTNLGLATTSPSGITYSCVVSTSSRNINATGWIPVNLSLLSSGSPISSFPIDPTNQSSTGLYYTYYGNGTQYEATALFESSKYKSQYGQTPIAPSYPEVGAVGSNLTINPLFNSSGLVGYWPMDEATGSITVDQSGNGNSLTISTAGSSSVPVWSTSNCKIGSACFNFAGINRNDAYTATNATFQFTGGNFTFAAWAYTLSGASNLAAGGNANSGVACQSLYGGWLLGPSYFLWCTPAQIGTATNGAALSYAALPTNTWTYVAVSFSSAGNVTVYYNGVLKASAVTGGIGYQGSTAKISIGCEDNAYNCFNGQIDDARLYSRALSMAEIQALYNAEK